MKKYQTVKNISIENSFQNSFLFHVLNGLYVHKCHVVIILIRICWELTWYIICSCYISFWFLYKCKLKPIQIRSTKYSRLKNSIMIVKVLTFCISSRSPMMEQNGKDVLFPFLLWLDWLHQTNKKMRITDYCLNCQISTFLISYKYLDEKIFS